MLQHINNFKNATDCGEIPGWELGEDWAFPVHPCELPMGHDGSHRANGVRWELVIDYDEDDTLP